MKLLSKPVKTLFFSFLLVGGTAFAQQPQQPQPPQQQQQPAQQENISDGELSNFANAFMGIQEVNQKAQEEMISVVEDSGFELERFNQIYESSQNPNQPAPDDVSEEETQKFQKVVEQMETMQPKFQKEMEAKITDNDLTVDRYQEMVAVLQTNPELQERLQAMME